MPSRRKLWALGFLVLALVAAITVTVVLLNRRPPRCQPPYYAHAAVAADTLACSRVGRDILQGGGSAVDAAIAALVCTAVFNPQSMGLGGGVIFTIYNATTGKAEVINARERAPRNISGALLDKCQRGLSPGAQWIAIPGELRGYEEAHRRYGALPWKALFEPTIEILRTAVRVPEVLNRFLNHSSLRLFLERASLRKLFTNERGDLLKLGDPLHWPALRETLRAVAENGADEFYLGETARKLVQDVRRESGSLTLEDLRSYRVSVKSAIRSELGGYTIYSAPRPAAGPILLFILNVLKGFNLTKDSVSTTNGKSAAYHYIAEALKFANGQKAKLDDPDFSEIREDETDRLISDAFAAAVRKRIDARGDHAATFYNLTLTGSAPYGTSHVAVLVEDGSAVSATSTINHPFGSMVYSEQTGIILNNELADFCMKQSNRKISPGEMPPSSMTPSILISRDGKSELIIGGSGGTLIVPAVALAIANKLWFGYDLEGAIQAPIFYATVTGSLKVERNFDQETVMALRQKGHVVDADPYMLNVVQGVSKDGPCLFPYADRRKNGEASGY